MFLVTAEKLALVNKSIQTKVISIIAPKILLDFFRFHQRNISVHALVTFLYVCVENKERTAQNKLCFTVIASNWQNM